MLENPEALRAMVKTAGAVSTDYQSPESVDHLCEKNDTLCRKLEGHGGGALERMRQLRCLREKGVTYDGPLSDLHRCSGGLQSPTVCIPASHWRHPYAGRDWQSGMYIRSGTISAKHFYDLQKAGNYASASQITPIQYF